nr:ATP-binding protein [Ligilactobacillus ruminis]
MPLSSWGTVLNSMATAEAILDRLVYHSHVIKIKGKSYRLAWSVFKPTENDKLNPPLTYNINW